jgi:hypothetical protein
MSLTPSPTTLSSDNTTRKNTRIVGGVLGYFPAAIVGVAKHSADNNERYNPGQPMHWSIDKSIEHGECAQRHLLDVSELRVAIDRAPDLRTKLDLIDAILTEANALAWRALALSQTLHMEFDGAPMPFNARRSEPEPTVTETAVDDLEFILADYGAPAVDNVQDMGVPAFEPRPGCDCDRCIAARRQ